jgi:hypothetical protein
VGRVVLAVLVAACVCVAAASSGGAAPSAPARERPSLEAYSGLGAWISIYDKRAWRDPEGAVAKLAAHGVHTLFLETSNYRQRQAIVRPSVVGAFIEAAHARDIDIVAWYLPSLADTARDLRRSLAAVEFVTADGDDSFDSFALDIEATLVRSIARRNALTLRLATQLRAAVPDDYPLGAITIAPVGASPTYWPTFPFRGLSRVADVFLPMAYFTARTRGAAGVRAYTAANVRLIRGEAGDPAFPVHPIGGLTPRATPSEVRAFVGAAGACGALGAGLWEFEQTTAAEWAELVPLARPAAALATEAAAATC